MEKAELFILKFKLCFIWCDIPVFESFILHYVQLFTTGQRQKYTADCQALAEYREKQFLCDSVICAGKVIPLPATASRLRLAQNYFSFSFFKIIIGQYIYIVWESRLICIKIDWQLFFINNSWLYSMFWTVSKLICVDKTICVLRILVRNTRPANYF